MIHNVFQSLSKPPVTKELQRFFGLSRRESVQFHRDFSSRYDVFKNDGPVAEEGRLHDWNRLTHDLCSHIKNLRKPQPKKQRNNQFTSVV